MQSNNAARENKGHQVVSSVLSNLFSITDNNVSELTLSSSQIKVMISAVIEISNESTIRTKGHAQKTLRD